MSETTVTEKTVTLPKLTKKQKIVAGVVAGTTVVVAVGVVVFVKRLNVNIELETPDLPEINVATDVAS